MARQDAWPVLLEIRSAQLHALRREQLQPFVVELIPHLRIHCADELAGMPEWELCETVEECLLRALDHGLTRRCDLARFATLAACLGWSFDTDMAWPAELLRAPNGSPSDRMARVYERCLAELTSSADSAALRRTLGI